MKSVIPTVALFVTLVAAAAVPDEQDWYLRRAEDVSFEDLPIVDLEVTDDENFPGVTFTGTAESIVKEITALKPDFFKNETKAEITDEFALEKRQGTISCDWDGQLINAWSWCLEGMTYLMRLGDRGVMCGAGPSPACARVSCSRGCGMFLCTRTGSNIRRPCGNIPQHINAIASECIDVFGRFQGARYFRELTIGLKRQDC